MQFWWSYSKNSFWAKEGVFANLILRSKCAFRDALVEVVWVWEKRSEMKGFNNGARL